MTFLTATDETLRVSTSTSSTVVWTTSWVDHTTTAAPGSNTGSIASATTTTIVASPAASTSRQVVHASVRCTGAAPNTVIAIKGDGADDRQIIGAVLNPGESLVFTQSDGWTAFDAAGRRKTAQAERDGINGAIYPLFKAGTGADTVGYWYSHAKDAGFPGAHLPGTPGLSGRATDGTTAADSGCIPIRNPATGANYLSSVSLTSTVAQWFLLFDMLWINTGIVVTQTTEQTINSVGLPARCSDGTANGEGLMIGLLTTVANTNAGLINNATVTYTNSNGDGSRVATLANLIGTQIPITPVIGTLVWFMLAAGDKGVRSIQSITLGTSLGGGSVSLLLARPIWSQPVVVANVGAPPQPPLVPGVRLYNGTCALACYQAAAVTATTTSATLTVIER